MKRPDEVARLLKHYRAAVTTGNLDAGTIWYRVSRGEAARISKATGVDLETAAGVIAAVSPRVQWDHNVRLAETLCAGKPGKGLGTSLRAAGRILAGEDPLDVLKGLKTSAFFRAIMGDEDAAVIDVWMIRAMGDDPSKGLTSKRYGELTGHLRAAARIAGIGTATFQAIVWTQVRGGAA